MKLTQMIRTETAVGGDATADVEDDRAAVSADETENPLESDTRTAQSDAPPSTAEKERALPLDQTFELLKNQRRRYVLEYLESEGEPVSLSELAEQIAAWENDKEVRLISSSERKRVYVGLYQCHLPKMDGMGAISFNKPRGIIERGENADCLIPYLQSEDDANDTADDRFYGGLAVAGLTLLTVLTLRVETTTILFGSVAIVFLATLFAAYRLSRRTV
jgi:hypothetical protein